MTKKWKVGAVYEIVDKTSFLENMDVNEQILPYVSDKFKVLELDRYHNVTSVENIDLWIRSSRSDGSILVPEERKFFKRVKD